MSFIMPNTSNESLRAYAFDNLLVLHAKLANPISAALTVFVNGVEVSKTALAAVLETELIVVGMLDNLREIGEAEVTLSDASGRTIVSSTRQVLRPLTDETMKTMSLAARHRAYDLLLKQAKKHFPDITASLKRSIASSIARTDLFAVQTGDHGIYCRLPWPTDKASTTTAVQIGFDQSGGIRLTREAQALIGNGWLHILMSVPNKAIENGVLFLTTDKTDSIPIRIPKPITCSDDRSLDQAIFQQFEGNTDALRDFVGRCRADGATGSTAPATPVPSRPDYAGNIDFIALYPAQIRVLGWLWNSRQPDQPVDGRLVLENKVIATVSADRFRPNLLEQGIGNGRHAFDVTVQMTLSEADAKRLRLAPINENRSLHQSAECTIQRMFDTGSIDRISTDTIIGWVHPAFGGKELRMVEAYIGDQWLGSGLANRFRGDVAQHFRTEGFVGFMIPLSRPLTIEDLSHLRIVDALSEEGLTISPEVIAEARGNLESAGQTDNVHDYACHVDAAGEVVWGWAFDKNAPGERVMLHAFIDELYVTSVIADGERPDVSAEFETDGFCGFAFSLPAGLDLSGTVTLDLRYRDSGESLADMPMEITLGLPGRVHKPETIEQRSAANSAIRPYCPPPDTVSSAAQPSVAVIVLNRNGETHLEKMFRSFYETNTYQNFEFIIIDHGSTDQSRLIALDWADKLPIRLVNRRLNYSYAESNNFAASLADAEFLFLLNNDIEFIDDTLGKLIDYCSDPKVGIVGMKLLTPEPPTSERRTEAMQMLAELLEAERKSEADERVEPGAAISPQLATTYLRCVYEQWFQQWKKAHGGGLGYSSLAPESHGSQHQVQHMGVKFETSHQNRAFLPYEVPYHPNLKPVEFSAWEVPAVTAGAFLIRRSDFEAIGGFHEDYFYGFEDVDFCLLAHQELKKKILCANDVAAFHDRSASRTQHTPYEKRITEKNKATVEQRTTPFVRGLMKEKILDDSLFWRGHPFRVAFAVSDNAVDSEAGDYFTACELGQALTEQHGWEIHYLNPDEWYDLKSFDIIIALVHGFDPSKIETTNPFLIKIVWVRNWFDGWLALPSTLLFDQIWVASQKAVERFSEQYNRPIVLMRIATNERRFSDPPEVGDYRSDYCFTGSFFQAPRALISQLEPDALPYTFRLFGRNWEQIPWLQKYLGGPLAYDRMPAVYGSTRIVLDDANHTVKEWGSVNSRVFDALAAGALVFTNGKIGAEELFGKEFPVFDSKEELTALLGTYLEDDDARIALVEKFRAEVLKRHTYRHRAQEVRDAIAAALHYGRCRIVTTNGTEPSNLKQLRSWFYEAFAGAGYQPRLDSGSQPDHSLRYGDDLAIVIAGSFEDAPPVSDFSDATARILVLLCRLDQIARAYCRTFDVIITATQEDGKALAKETGQTVFTLNEPALLGRASHRLERELGERLMETMTGQVVPAVTEWMTEQLSTLRKIPRPKISLLPAVRSDRTDTPHHIAYVLWDFPALSQTFVLSELRWLKRHGYDVTVYYKIKPDKPATLDFPIDAYQVTDPNDLADHLTANKHTVIHCHFAYPAMAELAWPAAKLTQLACTVMVHAVDIFHYANQNRNRLREIANDTLCRKVFTLGDFHRDFLVSRGVPTGKIATIGQSAVLPEYHFDEATITERLYAPKRIIGSISRFTEKKGLSVLIDAAAELAGFEIRLYGYGPLQERLERQIEALNLNNVKMMEPIDQSDGLAAALNEIDLFVAPCIRTSDGDMDGIPTVLLEAMAFGIPVIATRVAGIPDLIRHGVNGFLAEQRDPADLTRVIKGVAGMNPERLRRIVGNARAEVQNRYGVDKTMPAMLDVWNGEMLDIFLVTFDRPGYHTRAETKDMINRLYKYTSTDFRLTIVDNDSDPSFISEIEQLILDKPNAELIKLEENVLCGPASNIAMAKGHSKFMVYLCSKEGFVFKHGWERECIRYMEQNPDVAIAGNLIYSPKYYNAETYRQQEWFQHFREPDFLDREPDKRFVHVQGGFFILRRAAYEQCGGFNGAIPQGGMDIEYSYYLESQGWKLGSLPNVKIITTLTRPTLQASCDEKTIVAHPLTVQQAQELDSIVKRRTKKCNVCSWSGKTFEKSDTCPNCGATPFARTMERYLADSTLIYRGLRCLAIMHGDALRDELGRFFDLTGYLCADGSNADTIIGTLNEIISRSATDVLIIDHLPWSKAQLNRLCEILSHLIAQGSRVFIGENAYIAALAQPGLPIERVARLDSIRLGKALPAVGRTIDVRYDSEVILYDWQDIFELAALEAVIPSAVNYREGSYS
jgi:GT2 family glycosyltransferase/glycosyltransferase involved in cell wall biosynthesis